MKFAWTLTLSALLAGGQIAAGTTLFANDSDTNTAVPAKALTVANDGNKTEASAPETFETKFEAAIEIARTGGEDKLPIPERFVKAVEVLDQAWEMDRTKDETSQAIRMKFSLLLAIGRDSDRPSEQAIAFLKDLADDSDPETSLQAESMLLSIELSQLSALPADEQGIRLEDLKDEIVESEPTVRTATLAVTIANAINRHIESEAAIDEISDLAKHFSSVQDEEIQKAATRLFGLSNRLNLLGNPIEITGTTLDGKQLDFPAKYEGKTILVDFWATWCGPCVAEMPNMKRLYDIYHPHGFEIIGISLNDEKSDVDEFVQSRDIPWPIVWNEREEGQSGWIDANAARYGISGIPTMILVGEDGNVVSLTARGHNLDQLLAEAYPDVEVSAKTAETE